MKWITSEFPRLRINGVAHFANGAFVSDDAVVIAKMAAWVGKYGITQTDDDPTPLPLDPWPQYPLEADLLDGSGKVKDAKLPSRLSDVELRAAFGSSDKSRHSALRAARAAIAARSLNALHIGDSITDGYNAMAFGKQWTQRFPAAARSRLGLPAGGLGFLTPAHTFPSTGYPVTGDLTSGNTGYGLAGRSLQFNSSSGFSTTLTLPVGHTGVDISVVGYSGGGTLSYTVDGGAATTVSTNRGATAGGVIAASIRGLSPSTVHTIVASSSAGTVFIEGFMCYAGDEAAGVRPMAAGMAGYTSTAWLAANNANQLDVVKAYLPRLVTIELGVNDYTTGDSAGQTVTPAQLTTNLQSIISQVRAYYPAGDLGPSFVLMGMWQRGNAGGVTLPHTWDEYMQAYQSVASADANGLVTVLDIRERVNQSTDPALGTAFGVVDTDQIHPTDLGHQLIADALTDLLLSP